MQNFKLVGKLGIVKLIIVCHNRSGGVQLGLQGETDRGQHVICVEEGQIEELEGKGDRECHQ